MATRHAPHWAARFFPRYFETFQTQAGPVSKPSCLPSTFYSGCRALLAVGTLAAEHSKVRALARDLGFLSLADSLKASGSGKVAEVAAEVAAKLRL